MASEADRLDSVTNSENSRLEDTHSTLRRADFAPLIIKPTKLVKMNFNQRTASTNAHDYVSSSTRFGGPLPNSDVRHSLTPMAERHRQQQMLQRQRQQFERQQQLRQQQLRQHQQQPRQRRPATTSSYSRNEQQPLTPPRSRTWTSARSGCCLPSNTRAPTSSC